MNEGEIPTRSKAAGPGRFSTIYSFDTIDSTNRYLLDLAADGAPEGVVAVAAHQTAGRGRRGRVWDSKPGASLLFSVLFRPEPAMLPIRYAQAVGLAVSEGLESAGGFTSTLKWPNDVVVGARKLAGVLAEGSSSAGAMEALVVGCGINLNWGTDLPAPLRETAISADEAAGKRLDPEETLQVILQALEVVLADSGSIPERYRERCSTIGQRVRVERADGDLVGLASDVDDSGALVVQTDDGEQHLLTVGEVVHLRSL